MPLPVLVFQVTGFFLNLIIVCFIIYYFMQLRVREKAIEEKEKKVDTNYHQIVDDALSKERKILEDATTEADKILTDAKYVNSSSQKSVDQALEKMVGEIKTETDTTSKDFRKTYETSLQQIATTSLQNFQTVSKGLQTDLEAQIKKFHETLLPNMEKELESYKQSRLKQAEQVITKVVAEASQQILNKSISFEDHQRLMTESLEKAKQEGLFD